jgi:hypothetical protein
MNKTAEAATAYHEAGHAIIAWRRGLFIKGATIEQNKIEDYLGRVVGNFAAGISHEIEYSDISPRGPEAPRKLCSYVSGWRSCAAQV